MPDVSEIYEIPGNRDLSPQDRDERTKALYRPFHARIEEIVAARQARGQQTALLTMHSFTPVYHGVKRAVEIGVLHDADSRLTDAMLMRAADTSLYRIARNELPNVMIEVRNDLISDETGQDVAADFLTGLLQESLSALS